MADEKYELSFSQELNLKLEDIADALPTDFNRSRCVQNALAVCNQNPELFKINRAHVIAGIVKGAVLGLDFARKECYLIPYGNSVQFQTDYKGEKKIIERWSTRPILDVYAKLVRDGDSFVEKIVDGHPSIDFTPVPFSNAKIVGAFAVVNYKDGGIGYETMTAEEIDATRRSYSKAANSKAWQNSWGEMAKKTVLRRLAKHINIDIDSEEGRKAWEDGSDADFSDNRIKARTESTPVDVFAEDSNVVDAEAVFVESEVK